MSHTGAVSPGQSRTHGQYLHGIKALRVESRALASLASDEVRIAIRCTSICGSDVHYFNHLCNGSILVREPLCLGHEAAGQIVAAGSGPTASQFKLGDAVALECGVPCGRCAHCRGGSYNICPELRFRSSGSKFPHYQGTLQELVQHPARWIHRLPPELDFEIGSLLEPLAVAVHAVRRGGPYAMPSARTCCLVFGAGAVGLLCAVAARVGGCRDVVMVDVDLGRLAFALEQGFASAVHAVEPGCGQSLQDRLDIARGTAADIARLTWPDGETIGRVPETFECSGAESCVQSGIYATESGGTVVLVGMGTPNHTLPISELSAREINLVSTWRYADAYPRAIEIAKASVTGTPVNGTRLPDIRTMITHRFAGLERVPDALEMAGRARDAAGRLVVKTVVGLPLTQHVE